MPKSKGRIPKAGIGLSDAHGKLVEELVTGAVIMPEFSEVEKTLLRKSRQYEDSVEHDPEVYAEIAEEWHLGKVANLFLRSSLEEGVLTAFVRDPATGETLQIGREHWVPAEWWEKEYVPSGIWSDFISSSFYDGLGPPGTRIGKKKQPVFLLRSKFNEWIAQYATRKRTGRPKGAGGYLRLDASLYPLMCQLITEKQVQSVTEAARQVQHATKGASPEATIDRLVRGYNRSAAKFGWPTVPPAGGLEA